MTWTGCTRHRPLHSQAEGSLRPQYRVVRWSLRRMLEIRKGFDILVAVVIHASTWVEMLGKPRRSTTSRTPVELPCTPFDKQLCRRRFITITHSHDLLAPSLRPPTPTGRKTKQNGTCSVRISLTPWLLPRPSHSKELPSSL